MGYLEFDINDTELNDQEKDQLINDDERQKLLIESIASEKDGGQKYAMNLRMDAMKNQSKDAFSVNNKHESLFCCGRRGSNFLILVTAQFIYKMFIFFFAFSIVKCDERYKAMAKDQTALIVYSVILTLIILILLYVWLFLLPELLTSFTITTNVSHFLVF